MYPDDDDSTADDFLRSYRHSIKSYTGWGNLWQAWQLWNHYQSLPKGPAKAEAAVQILENGLYYGQLFVNGKLISVGTQTTASDLATLFELGISLVEMSCLT